MKHRPKDFVLIRPIQDLNGTIPNKMIFKPGREKIKKCRSGKVARAEIGKIGILGTAERCGMVETKERESQVSCRPAAMLLAAYDGSSSSWN
jgi:hypothetical protein